MLLHLDTKRTIKIAFFLENVSELLRQCYSQKNDSYLLINFNLNERKAKKSFRFEMKSFFAFKNMLSLLCLFIMVFKASAVCLQNYVINKHSILLLR